MKWSEVVTLEFVKIYLKKECLWNPLHPYYKLKFQREKCYYEIVSEFKTVTSKTLSLTIPEVKMKIKNLRTTYSQQVHKILEKSNPDTIYEPSLIWFQEMDRCLKNIPNNRYNPPFHQSLYNKYIKPEVDSSCQPWIDPNLNKTIDEESNTNSVVPPTNLECESEHMPTNSSAKDKQGRHKKSKKKKNKHKMPIPDCSTDSMSEKSLKEDEFDIYGKFIASQLRQMDLSKALRLQLAIQNLVSEARMSDLSNDE